MVCKDGENYHFHRVPIHCKNDANCQTFLYASQNLLHQVSCSLTAQLQHSSDSAEMEIFFIINKLFLWAEKHETREFHALVCLPFFIYKFSSSNKLKVQVLYVGLCLIEEPP
jgi:hypothetical protein